MKVYAFILSFFGCCIFYICNADWIDELIENCLGSDYEEIGPFVPSVPVGIEEFDRIVEELKYPKGRWWLPSFFLLSAASCFLFFVILIQHRFHPIKTSLRFLSNLTKSTADREEIQTIVAEYIEKKIKQLCGSKETDEVPVKLLWKGGALMESSIHCNVKDDLKLQRRILQPKFFSTSPEKEKQMTSSFSSETSTVRKMSQIRKLLESEQELEKFVDEFAETLKKTEKMEESKMQERSTLESRERNSMNKEMEDRGEKTETEGNFDPSCGIELKLMNRIRLLESRLRLEELKNKNWINRMSKAEDILRKLNKQVEQIEETQPVGTLTGTLKIMSTVTNWSPASHPRRNMRFTLINRYPSFSGETPPYTSLSELIKKEVGLSAADDWRKSVFQLPSTPQILALPSPIVMPPSSFLSKFLCR